MVVCFQDDVRFFAVCRKRSPISTRDGPGLTLKSGGRPDAFPALSPCAVADDDCAICNR
jgi:hypothetical protein